jgi:hypothetical protein
LCTWVAMSSFILRQRVVWKNTLNRCVITHFSKFKVFKVTKHIPVVLLDMQYFIFISITEQIIKSNNVLQSYDNFSDIYRSFFQCSQTIKCKTPGTLISSTIIPLQSWISKAPILKCAICFLQLWSVGQGGAPW